MKYMEVDDRHVVIRVPLPRVGRPQLSLRAAILSLTVICLVLGYLGSRVHQARRQHDAVRHVWRTGGSVCYSGKVHYRMFGNGELIWAGHDNPPAGFPKDSFWRTHLGTDFFDTVTSVTIGSRSKTPVRESLDAVRNSFSHLAFLPSVESIYVKDVAIQDIDIEAMKRCRNLKRVGATGNHGTEQIATLLRAELPNCVIYP